MNALMCREVADISNPIFSTFMRVFIDGFNGIHKRCFFFACSFISEDGLE